LPNKNVEGSILDKMRVKGLVPRRSCLGGIPSKEDFTPRKPLLNWTFFMMKKPSIESEYTRRWCKVKRRNRTENDPGQLFWTMT
jgi:hypothetical protein